MTEPWLCPGSMWEEKLPALRRLGNGALTRADLLNSDFLLAREGRLEVYWIPFERLTAGAKIVLAGLTPGYSQMAIAFTAARDAVRARSAAAEVLAWVDRSASFAGAMRTNLVAMLDELGVAEALEIDSTIQLFGVHDDLLHTTSALRYPVFVGGKNYSGGRPPVFRSPPLTSYVETLLAPELKAVPDALIIPLGKATEQCVRWLVDAGVLDERRCLFGFPHPSGANVGRVAQFDANAPNMGRRIRAWASAG